MKTVLYKTTRGWNIGDEVILRGVIHLITKCIGEHNHLLYNCHPSIDRTSKNHDDSMFLGFDTRDIDLAVIAGTPEVFSDRLNDFYKMVLNNNIPFIIIGSGDHSQSHNREHARRAKLITVRQKNLLPDYRQTFGRGVVCLPCPSIFCADKTRKIDRVEKCLLVYDTKNSKMHGIGQENYDAMKRYFDWALGRWPCDMVVHRGVELFDAKKNYSSMNIMYRYDWQDLIDIYSRYDFVVSPRIHGCGIAASMAIPSAMTLVNDFRIGTVSGFLSFLHDTLNVVDENEIVDRHKRLIVHKEASEKSYIELIGNALN